MPQNQTSWSSIILMVSSGCSGSFKLMVEMHQLRATTACMRKAYMQFLAGCDSKFPSKLLILGCSMEICRVRAGIAEARF